MAKTGTLSHSLFLSEVAKTTEGHSADMIRSSDVEKDVLKRD